MTDLNVPHMFYYVVFLFSLRKFYFLISFLTHSSLRNVREFVYLLEIYLLSTLTFIVFMVTMQELFKCFEFLKICFVSQDMVYLGEASVHS